MHTSMKNLSSTNKALKSLLSAVDILSNCLKLAFLQDRFGSGDKPRSILQLFDVVPCNIASTSMVERIQNSKHTGGGNPSSKPI